MSNMIIFLLIFISLELGLAVYFIYYSLVRPELEKKRKFWDKFHQKFSELEESYENK